MAPLVVAAWQSTSSPSGSKDDAPKDSAPQDSESSDKTPIVPSPPSVRPQDPVSASVPPLERSRPNEIARIGEQSLTLDQYRDYLLASRGLRDLEAFLDRQALRRAAQKQRVSIPYDKIDRSTQDRLSRLVTMFGDDRAAAESSLARRGLSWSDYRETIRSELIWDHLLGQLYRSEASLASGTEGSLTTAGHSEEPGVELTAAQRRKFLDRLRAEEGVRRLAPEDALERFRIQYGW